jgi:formylglycine-generating enzyme required for sulfatase activity
MVNKLVTGIAALLALAGVSLGQDAAASAPFFRIVSLTNIVVTALSTDGTLVWTNDVTVGVTCIVQRAFTLQGPSNWVDYVQHAATDRVMALRVFDPATPAGMAFIPAGSFQMGDTFGEGYSAELPVHTVYISAFHMDKTEVTWGKWKEVRTWATANDYDIGSVGSSKADNHPVHSVNWHDCVKWLNARSQMEGLTPCYTSSGAVYMSGRHDDIVCNWSANGYRLPTDAEWEKAARGGLSGRRFPWGDTIQHTRANYKSEDRYAYDTSATRDYHPSYATGFPHRYSYATAYPYTRSVGAFAANGYGLHDMAGNLFEWCWDWCNDYPSGSVSNPRGPSAPSPKWGSRRVFRSGGFGHDARYCRVARRLDSWPDDRSDYLGFRTVRSSGQQ